MRFRFCGDQDCPEWVLAEISILSRLSSVKMKLLCSHVIKDILGQQFDYEKLLKLTADAKFESGDVKASVAVLTFIYRNATKFNVNSDSLSSELQQLGLPKEHSTVLCKVHEENNDTLRSEFLRTSLRLSRLESIDWRVDYILGSSHLKEVCEPTVELRLKVQNPGPPAITESLSFSLTADKFKVFLHELKQAHEIMNGLTAS